MPGVTPTPTVAYFTMEAGLDPAMPTYSGGLGILAGDTLRAAADLGMPMFGITLLHRKGYFRQHLDAHGNQSESACIWSPDQFLDEMPPRVTITLAGRPVAIRCWRYRVQGVTGHVVPVYFLDADLEENAPGDRTLTDYLYGGDQRYRVSQEAVLGIGGVAMARALGYQGVRVFHMNEGHSALLVLALLAEQNENRQVGVLTESAREAIRRMCVFTTHTPIPAGHDQFPTNLMREILGDATCAALGGAGGCLDRTLNMTYLALYFAHYVNGVALRHGEISRDMFPNYPINSITNGVHATTWTSPPFQRVYDRHFPEWRRDNRYLRYAVGIPLAELRQAHAEAKRSLLDEVRNTTGVILDPTAMTIGFARRATPYKRANLLFTDVERLRRMSRQVGPLQVLFAGKAHPRDEGGKALIRQVFDAAKALRDDVKIIYLEDYDMALAALMCAGADVWLNTPQKPQEASGTSGMKAAMNGVPSLSVRDGWWLEGHFEGVTGWSIGASEDEPSDQVAEARSLYDKLENVILPLYHRGPDSFAEIMRSTIALNASFFNSQRMMSQYMQNAYLPSDRSGHWFLPG